MRLDKYVKVSRIIKRRTVAKEAGEGGRVSINGKTAKPSAEVKEGDVIEIRFGEKLARLRVLSVAETVRKNEASAMYEMSRPDAARAWGWSAIRCLRRSAVNRLSRGRCARLNRRAGSTVESSWSPAPAMRTK